MFFEKLNSICKEKGTSISAVLLALGMSKSNATRWRAGQSPKLETVEALAAHLGVNVSAFSDDAHANNPLDNLVHLKSPSETIIHLPIIGSISAGNGCVALEEYTGEYVPFPLSMLKGNPSDYFVLRVNGDSMYPRLLDGDMVLVLRQSTVENGKVAVVMFNGDEATIKKVEYNNGKSLDLIPYNPEYKTRHIEGAELEQCRILGRVVHLIRDM